jgi:hypothetical protein
MVTNKRNTNSQSGFEVVTLLIVVAVIGFIIASGIYVKHRHASSLNTQTGNDVITANKTIKTTPAATPTASYTTYTDKDYKYSFQYPQEWGTVKTEVTDGGQKEVLKFTSSSSTGILGIGPYYRAEAPLTKQEPVYVPPSEASLTATDISRYEMLDSSSEKYTYIYCNNTHVGTTINVKLGDNALTLSLSDDFPLYVLPSTSVSCEKGTDSLKNYLSVGFTTLSNHVEASIKSL